MPPRRDSFGLDEESRLGVALGHLAEQKNYPTLLRAVSAVPDTTLAIAGDGPRYDELAALAGSLGAGERVRFLGHVERERVPDLLRAADIFAQPSLFEGQSNALLEAMCEGLLILASDIPPQRETLVDEAAVDSGLLLPLHGEAGWTAALREVGRAACKRDALSRRARQQVRAFSVEAMADRLERSLGAEAREAARRHG